MKPSTYGLRQKEIELTLALPATRIGAPHAPSLETA